jgi:hypothetical protein
LVPLCSLLLVKYTWSNIRHFPKITPGTLGPFDAPKRHLAGPNIVDIRDKDEEVRLLDRPKQCTMDAVVGPRLNNLVMANAMTR